MEGFITNLIGTLGFSSVYLKAAQEETVKIILEA
jgi:hypothetical protein